MSMSKSKFENMNAVANEAGIIAAAAMDQRGSLKKSIAAAKGISNDAVTDTMMCEFKTAVTKALSPHSTAMLLDPTWGLEGAGQRTKGCGLILAYEESGYDNTMPGRMPILLKDYSVKKLQSVGANCVKILLYYSPFEDAKVNAAKHEWVAKIGAECENVGLPFFLEFVAYDPKGGDEKGAEFAKLKPQVVLKSMQEFNKPEYKVDVMKVEIPVNLKFTKGCRSYSGDLAAYDKSAIKDHYQACAAATNKPFIYLSAGVSDDEFRESLELANEFSINYSGVLCGRATWKEGIPVYGAKGIKALEDWLEDRGVANIKALNKVINAGAHAWWDAFGGKDKVMAA